MTLFDVSQIADGQSKSLSPSVFAVKRAGRLFVYQNECPHLGINLEFERDEFLDRDASHIICSTHGALFEIETGECIFGPCSGESLQALPYVWHGNDKIEVNL